MSKTLRILTLATLFPNPARPNFGIFVARQTVGLARRDNVDLTVINPIGLPPFPLSRMRSHHALSKLEARDMWEGIDIYRPHFRSLPFLPGRNPAAIMRAVLPIARRLHKQKPFDLIDAEFFWPDGPAAMMLAERLRIPFTVKARGFDIHHWGNHPQSRSLMRNAAEKAAGLLAVSDALKGDMAALDMPKGKIKVHYTGIDRALFHPRDRDAEKRILGLSGPVICSVGALIERKRQKLLVEALTKLPGVTLILIGQGAEEQALCNLAKQEGVEDRVIFTGPLPHHEIARYLAASDIMALVSSAEGLANAWVEALASGTPVIACDVGGIRELVHNEIAGRIVPPDPEYIAQAVRILLNHPRDQQEVAAQVAHMSWDENSRQAEDFFRAIVERQSETDKGAITH